MVKAVIVFESMFGTTRLLAEAVQRGLIIAGAVATPLVNVNHTTGIDLSEFDLLVVGAPTHDHGLSTVSSRQEALGWPDDPTKDVVLDADAPGIGMAEWLDDLSLTPPFFAAFDSRWSHARMLTGAASVHLSERLVLRGSKPVVPDESFVVASDQLVAGEAYRAEIWGERLLSSALTVINRPPLTQRDLTQRDLTQRDLGHPDSLKESS